MDEGSSWTGSPSGYTRYPVSRWESARYDAMPGEPHLPERPSEAKVCTQEGMLGSNMAWCRHLKWVASFGKSPRLVKIFEPAFPLEVTPLPSPTLRLVFRSTLSHT